LRVNDVGRLHPSAPRLVYPELQQTEAARVMCVAGDNQFHAGLTCRHARGIREIETVGLGIDFQRASFVACDPHHLREIEIDRLALV
jgi:hypothetical protein